MLAELDDAGDAGRDVARRIRGGELHMTMTPEGLTPAHAGAAMPNEIHVQWVPSVQETASTLIHEAAHQADPGLAAADVPRSEIEANARVAEYEYRILRGLPPLDFPEQIYRTVLEDAHRRRVPRAGALAVARAAMIDAMRLDPDRYGIESAPDIAGGSARRPAAAPARVLYSTSPFTSFSYRKGTYRSQVARVIASWLGEHPLQFLVTAQAPCDGRGVSARSPTSKHIRRLSKPGTRAATGRAPARTRSSS